MGSYDARPCKGSNTNICVAEGCYGGSCLRTQKDQEILQAQAHAWDACVTAATGGGLSHLALILRKENPYREGRDDGDILICERCGKSRLGLNDVTHLVQNHEKLGHQFHDELVCLDCYEDARNGAQP